MNFTTQEVLTFYVSGLISKEEARALLGFPAEDADTTQDEEVQR